MYILDVMETCNDTTLSSVLPVVKNIMLLIQIIVPIVLLISFTADFIKLTINPEDKKGFRNILNKLIAAIIVFVLPFIVNVIMGAVGESTTFSDCWNKAPSTINISGEHDYVNIDEDEEVPYHKPGSEYNKDKEEEKKEGK